MSKSMNVHRCLLRGVENRATKYWWSLGDGILQFSSLCFLLFPDFIFTMSMQQQKKICIVTRWIRRQQTIELVNRSGWGSWRDFIIKGKVRLSTAEAVCSFQLLAWFAFGMSQGITSVPCDVTISAFSTSSLKSFYQLPYLSKFEEFYQSSTCYWKSCLHSFTFKNCDKTSSTHLQSVWKILFRNHLCKTPGTVPAHRKQSIPVSYESY